MLLVVIAFGLSADDIRQQVICAETGFSRAAEARDPDAFIRFVDPDARFIGDGVSRGREAVLEAWTPFLSEGGPAIRWRPQTVEVTDDGSLALSRGPYRVRVTDEEGGIRESWGHFNSTWRRDADGTWQVVFDAGGDAGMTPTADEIRVLDAEPDCP